MMKRHLTAGLLWSLAASCAIAQSTPFDMSRERPAGATKAPAPDPVPIPVLPQTPQVAPPPVAVPPAPPQPVQAPGPHAPRQKAATKAQQWREAIFRASDPP